MPTKSSRRWLKEHFNDQYVKKAQQSGYRSRAVFKLIELQERDKLFKPGMIIVDLGAAPGSWSQYLSQIVGPKGQVFAIDILPMDPLPDVFFIQGDFTQEEIFQILLKKLNEKKVDWVVSDMAPNLSGVASIDQPRALYLAELAFDLAVKVESTGLLVKVFQGEGVEEFLVRFKQHFKKVLIRKPKASRGRSKEIYVIGR